MAGRRPKTSQEKRLAGNPGKRKIHETAAPVAGEPARPAWMRDDAAAEWDRVTEILRLEGRLNLSEAPALEKLCIAHERWIRLVRTCSNPRTPLTKLSVEGGEKPNPVFQMERLTAEQCRRLYNDFGLTPGTRGRVKVPDKPKTDKDRLRDRFFRPALVPFKGHARP